MAKLSDLIKFKNSLVMAIENFKIDVTSENIKILDQLKEYNHPVLPVWINQLSEANEKNTDTLNNLKTLLNTLTGQIKEVLEQKMVSNQTVTIGSDVLTIPNHISARMGQRCSWRGPGLLIGVKSKDMVDLMSACEPLYISEYSNQIYLTEYDIGRGSINDLINKYPPQFQKKLRIYEIKNQNYSRLPKNQFNIVIAWNYLNYCPAADIKKYLQEIFNLLKSGGSFLFSYNNCNYVASAQFAENQMATYVNMDYINEISQEIGYEIVALRDDPFDSYLEVISWAELKKPGELTTIKTRPVIGRAIPK